MSAESTSPIIIGTEGDDFLRTPVDGGSLAGLDGGDGDDTLDGGAGNDVLHGGYGDDTYLWRPEAGAYDVIHDPMGNDSIRIDATSSQLTFMRDPNTTSLKIVSDGAVLEVEGYFDSRLHIENIVFSDGIVWHLDDVLRVVADTPSPPPHGEPPLPPENPPHQPGEIHGTSGNDLLVGGAEDNLIVGWDGDDTLDGGAGNNLLVGGLGNDTYRWTGGNDVIVDHGGDDTVEIALGGHLTWSYQVGTDDLLVAADSGETLIVKHFFDPAVSIERFTFSNGDVLTRADVLERLPFPPHEDPPLPPLPPEEPPHQPGEIHGTGGNDLLVGGAEDNLVFGYDGDDTLAGGTGNNLLVGGSGNDTYRWNGGWDVIEDSSGDDTVEVAFDGFLTWSYQVGADDLLIGAGDAGSLIVRHFFNSENGIERFTFSNGDVLTRADILERLPFPPHEDPPPPENPPPHEEPPPSPRVMIGTDGDDILIGSDLDDTIDGGAGNDLLEGGLGDDTYIWVPGKGSDVVRDYGGGQDKVIIDATPDQLKFYTHPGEPGHPLIIQFGDDVEDRLYIEGYFNGDPFRNGQIETLVFSNGVEWRMADVLAVVRDVPGPVPNPHPEPNPDPIPDPIPEPNPDPEIPPPDEHPDPQPDPQPDPTGQLIIGTAGNDVLVGGGGHDTLDGGAGQDLLKGGAGNDTYRWALGSGNDTISDASGTDTLSIFANSSEVTLTASGHDFADLTIGLHGQTLVVRDYFVVTASGGYLENIAFADGQVWQVDRVWQALQTRIGGKGNDIIVGNDLANILKGGSGRDKLNGGKGNDKLFGGHDKDVLTGGVGRDVFVFTKAADAGLGKNRDTITDFKCGSDRIDLSGIDANSLTKADNSFTKLLFGKAKFTAAGQLRYDAKTGILSGNTDKDAAAEFEIQLQKSKLHLKLSDFVL